MIRFEDSRLPNLIIPDNLDQIGEETRNPGRMMRQMISETAQKLGSEFNEVVKQLGKGHTPEQIKKEISIIWF